MTRTSKLENFIKEDLSGKTTKIISGVRRDILMRTLAFLLLKDSKASFRIEGEVPSHPRANRWGKVIGQAGTSPMHVTFYWRSNSRQFLTLLFYEFITKNSLYFV